MQEKDLQNLLIEILRSELTETLINEDVNDKLTPEIIVALYKLSKTHDLAHIVSSALGKLGMLNGDEISQKYQKQELLSVYRCENLKYEFDDICKVFDNAKISYIPLKGSVIRQYYPYDSMRTSCDIDILVREEQLEFARDELVSCLNYKTGEKWDHDIAMDAPSGMHFELHYTLIDGNKKIDEVLSKVWEYSYPSKGIRCNMNNDFLLFYHIQHMAKHFGEGGCGIRPFMDMWIMEHKMGISRNDADELLKKAQLEKFAKSAFALADVWFEEHEHTSVTLDMQEYIMNAGVYGTEENNIIVSQTRNGSKFKHLLTKMFLPYSKMLLYYPSLAKCPVLFPFYQVRRWLRIATRKGGAKGAINHIKTSNSVTDERREHIQNLCRELGI